MFNTHAGGHCFQPIHIFEGNSGKPILSLIRPGKRPSGAEIARVLRTVIRRIRRHWPGVAILVRGDGHYCTPEVLDLLHEMQCDYILGLPTNTTLEAKAAPWREQTARRWWPSLGKVRRFHQFAYAAGSWSAAEKVIARVMAKPCFQHEATALGTDVRFIATNLPGRGKVLYEKIYCARGRMENLIKDLKLYTRVVLEARLRHEQDRVSSLRSQPVPAVPAPGRLLVAALGADGGAETITLAWRDVRHDPR